MQTLFTNLKDYDYINILGQDFAIQTLIIVCSVVGFFFISFIVTILVLVRYRINKSLSGEKFKKNKLIYNIETEIMKMVINLRE